MPNSHVEQQDGSDHGHTGKPARPDPQPEHGKDCEVHGQHGGVNEDHCDTTPTTTTTTTVTPTTTTTVPSPVSTTTTSVTVSPSTPGPGVLVAPGVVSVPLVSVTPAPARELPVTGLAGDLAPFGLALVLLGVALRRAVRR